MIPVDDGSWLGPAVVGYEGVREKKEYIRKGCIVSY